MKRPPTWREPAETLGRLRTLSAQFPKAIDIEEAYGVSGYTDRQLCEAALGFVAAGRLSSDIAVLRTEARHPKRVDPRRDRLRPLSAAARRRRRR